MLRRAPLPHDGAATFGLLIPQAVHAIFNDPWFPILIQGCLDACQAADLSLMLLMESSSDRGAVSRLIDRTMRGQHLDGLIISSSLIDDVLVECLSREDYPYVMIGRNLGSTNNFVDVDNRQASADGVGHLLGHGRTRPAVIAGPQTMVAALDRRDGFLDAIASAGIDPDTVPIRYVEYNQRIAYMEALDLLSSPEPPDAIFAASDSMAIGVLQAARKLHVDVPDALGVMGFDGIEPDRTAQLELSTIQQPAHELGRRAVVRLIELISDPTVGHVQEWLPTRVLLRGSCGCPSVTGSPRGPSQGKRGEPVAAALPTA